jgi:hypothetical protein
VDDICNLNIQSTCHWQAVIGWRPATCAGGFKAGRSLQFQVLAGINRQTPRGKITSINLRWLAVSISWGVHPIRFSESKRYNSQNGLL